MPNKIELDCVFHHSPHPDGHRFICLSPNVKPEQSWVSMNVCRICKYRQDSTPPLISFARQLADDDPPEQRLKQLPQCKELGRPLRVEELTQKGFDTATCKCESKIRQCGLHDICTTGEKKDSLACCLDCPDHSELKPVQGPRHLIYHVMPIRGKGAWQWNLDQLKLRLNLFNGVRSVAIIKDSLCDDPEAVREYLHDVRIDNFIEVKNNPLLREVVTWKQLWETVAHLPGQTFYAHAKGVTRPWNSGTSIQRWTHLLYSANLDFWPAVEKILSRYVLAGALKKIGYGFVGSRSSWHYSGCFYWIHNSELKDKWQQVDYQWWGAESWPGVHWRPDDGGCIFHEGTVATLDMYRLVYTEMVEAKFNKWKLTHVA